MDPTTGLRNQLTMSDTTMNGPSRSKAGRKRKTKEEDKCLVCGSKSIGLNFGVHSCSPCKAFFRRNAVKLGTYEFRCRNDGDCPLTCDTRRLCNCCRLAKCFRVGMDPKAIRTEDERLERRQLIEHNRRKRAEQITDDNKALQLVSKQRLPPVAELFLVEKLFIKIRPSKLFRYSQGHSSLLTSNDQTILTNIFGAYEETCIANTYKEHLNMPVNETLTLEKFMNASANMYMGLIYYLKCVPEFNLLPVGTKTSLIKSNLNQMVRVHSTLIMKMITPHLDVDSPVFLRLFPSDLYLSMRTTSTALCPFVNDPVLIKLLIIVLMLSTHMNVRYEKLLGDNAEEIHTLHVLNIQNIYVELLWRYIVSRCSDYRQSVRLLTSFITRTLFSQIVQVKLDRFVRTVLPDQSEQLEPIIKSICITGKKQSY